MDDIYLIWSNEHRAWWKPNSLGYTTDIRAAGAYTRENALDICDGATLDWTKAPNEIAICMRDLPDEPQMIFGIQLGMV